MRGEAKQARRRGLRNPHDGALRAVVGGKRPSTRSGACRAYNRGATNPLNKYPPAQAACNEPWAPLLGASPGGTGLARLAAVKAPSAGRCGSPDLNRPRNPERSSLEGIGPRKAQTRPRRAWPTRQALGRSTAKNMPPEMYSRKPPSRRLAIACDRDAWREHEQHFVSALLRRQASLTVPRGRFMIGPSPESADADEWT